MGKAQRILRIALATTALGMAGCGDFASLSGDASKLDPPQGQVPTYEAQIVVVDEAGGVLDGVRLVGTDGSTPESKSQPSGATVVQFNQPTLLIAKADGFLPQPFVVDRENANPHIRLVSRRGPNGERRIAMHFAGDVMLGRRYLAPTREGTAIVDPAMPETAAAVVDHVAPLFRSAAVRSLNFESVIGNLSDADAYPKKRFLLRSPPLAIDMLSALDANLVTLGNNHVRDWGEVGVASTIAHLDDAMIPHVGGGVSSEDAAAPRLLDADGHRIGFLSYTSVNGNFVNDALPGEDVSVPSDLPQAEAWQYEFRTFGFQSGEVTIESQPRRIGDAWTQIEAAIGVLDETDRAALWSAASEVYPELQDWVARRGHGGANPYGAAEVSRDVTELRATGCDLIVVQYHSGYQYADVPSSLVSSAAHRAIDNGADLVVCHHPHVLQGFEWYRGKLIAYSLGNFVFDQDFLATFSSAVLRVVFEDGELLSARLFPIAIDSYRPVPVGGSAARRIIQQVAERSVSSAQAQRIDGVIASVLYMRKPDAEPARLTIEHNTASIHSGTADDVHRTIELEPGQVVKMPPSGLLRTRGPNGAIPDVELGRDLFGWGDFEDVAADGRTDGGMHWITNDSYKRIEITPDAPSGSRCLRLRRHPENESVVLARPVARIPISRHRLYVPGDDGPVPADGEPSYSVRLQARYSGSAQPFLRFHTYAVADADPTKDPESERLQSVDIDLPVPADDRWHEIHIDLPPSVTQPPQGGEVDAVLMHIGLPPNPQDTSILFVDDVEFIEWREAGEMPDGHHDLTHVRLIPGASAGTITLLQSP